MINFKQLILLKNIKWNFKTVVKMIKKMLWSTIMSKQINETIIIVCFTRWPTICPSILKK
jgi:hypothetical protein